MQQAVRGELPSSRSSSSYYGQPLNSALLHLAKHKQPPHPLGWDAIDLPLKQHRRGAGRTLHCADPEQVGHVLAVKSAREHAHMVPGAAPSIRSSRVHLLQSHAIHALRIAVRGALLSRLLVGLLQSPGTL